MDVEELTRHKTKAPLEVAGCRCRMSGRLVPPAWEEEAVTREEMFSEA